MATRTERKVYCAHPRYNIIIGIAISSLLIAILIGLAIKPVLLDTFFSHQEQFTVKDGAEITKVTYGLELGKVIVIAGNISNTSAQAGTFTLSDSSGSITVYNTDKLNCFPTTNLSYKKVAGAYNIRSQNKSGDVKFIFDIGGNPAGIGYRNEQAKVYSLEFDGVWIIGGCK